jgi:tRNA A-37 threonylcarbamoyl transferase component Bud32
MLGRTIGRYKILEQLGQGGMSVVYKGLDTALDREVAVKVLHPHLSTREESRKRLAREARAVARLRHPNILEVYDFASGDTEEAYIVTEYIKGKTLRQFLTEQALGPPEVAAMVIQQIASALAHAHELSVIHRDIKPENVMLRDDGVLKLMDFGIAKIVDRDEKMTMTGALVGSPAHMAPEIIEGEEAGPEADVFSLGTMLYLFATGRLPFTANNTTATLKRILDGIYEDPRRLEPLVSDELAEIIATCLMRQPKARYPNAIALRDALTEHLSTLGLTRVDEELAQFFLDPPTYRKALTPRVTSALLTRAEKALADKRPARALSYLNLVLAHDPNNARTLELLAQMKAVKQRAERVGKIYKLATAAAIILIVGASVTRGVALATRPPDFVLPVVARGTDVRVPADVYPPPPRPPEPAPPPVAVVQPPPPEPVVQPRPIRNPKIAALNPGVGKKPVETPAVGGPTEVPVEVRVRPWGKLQIDGKQVGDKPDDEAQQWSVNLVPGKHKFKISCDACEEKGLTVDREVLATGSNIIALGAPLRPSLVTFSGFGEGAKMRIGAEERTQADAAKTPFKIVTPKEGRQTALHSFSWEVTVEGAAPVTGTATVVPGTSCTLTKEKPSCELKKPGAP